MFQKKVLFMKRWNLNFYRNKTVLLFLLVFGFGCSQSKQAKELKVLQFNIWQEGTVVENGYPAILDEAAGHEIGVVDDQSAYYHHRRAWLIHPRYEDDDRRTPDVRRKTD